MKVIVAVVVYNRLQNIKRWAECWKQCNTENADLIIIHNYYGDQTELNKYKSYCDSKGIKYVPRNGVGFDIGALQDVCKERLPDFPNDWQHLLWCTDDCIPMSKDFIKPFTDALQNPNVGISCMKISASVSPHVRTTGFCIRKELSKQIKFQVDPIKTKTDCYFWEHRGGDKTFTNQIRKMGLSCVMVAPDSISPLWDQGYHKRLDRITEHHRVFGEQTQGDKVTFICPIFDAFPEIISSLICQNHTNWELLLIDDNPVETITKAMVEVVNDKRIKYIKRERAANYGHSHRQWALNELRENRLSENAAYIVVTNGDNYYTPNFLKDMLAGFKKSHTTVATYSEKMVHSYKNWDVIPCKLERGYLDCGGVMVRKDVACEIGWSDVVSHSSDWTYFQEIINQYSHTSFQKVNGCLFCHN